MDFQELILQNHLRPSDLELMPQMHVPLYL